MAAFLTWVIFIVIAFLALNSQDDPDDSIHTEPGEPVFFKDKETDMAVKLGLPLMFDIRNFDILITIACDDPHGAAEKHDNIFIHIGNDEDCVLSCGPNYEIIYFRKIGDNELPSRNVLVPVADIRICEFADFVTDSIMRGFKIVEICNGINTRDGERYVVIDYGYGYRWRFIERR